MAVHDEAPLATLLKRYRLAMGFTQEELAERAEMSARSVSDIERGLNRSPLPNTLRRLADALELAGEQRANFLGATHEAREAAPPPIRIDGRSPTRRSFGLSLRWLAVATLTALLVAAAALTLLRGLASGSAHSLSSSSSAPAVLASWGSPVRQTFSWLIGGSAIPGPHGEGNLYGGTQVTLGVVRASSSGQQLSSWQASGFYASDSKADPLGNLWLATSNNDIEEYSPDGRLLARLGSAGYNQGQFENPEGLGITSNGSIVVGDAGNDRIQVLSPNGRVLRVWQGPGSNPQRFGPYIIAVDRSDNVYVADVGNVLIEKYSLQGKLLADWKLQGTPGAHTGIDLTVDAAGNVYTLVEHFTSPTSYFFHIYKQSPSGRTLAVWSHLAAPPARNRPLITSLRFNDHGVALAADWENSRILKLDPAGRVLGVWDARQLRLPLFRSPEGLATDAAGNVYVADASGVVEVVAGGQDAQRWAAPVASGPASHFSGVAVDLAGNIVVSDTGKNRIETFSPSGKLLRSWGRPGIAVGDLGNPAKLAVDEQGHILVDDPLDYRVSVFTPTGKPLRYWNTGTYWSAWSYGQCGCDITLDASGNVYLGTNDKVVETSPAGVPQRSWGTPGIGRGKFFALGGVALDKQGNVYTTDRVENTLQVFSPSGKLLAYWTRLGARGPRFSALGDLTVDGQGNIYVLNGVQLVELAPLASR